MAAAVAQRLAPKGRASWDDFQNSGGGWDDFQDLLAGGPFAGFAAWCGADDGSTRDTLFNSSAGTTAVDGDGAGRTGNGPLEEVV
jgi:hypothetical protein